MNSMSRFNRRGNVVVLVILIIAVVGGVWFVNHLKKESFPSAENVTSSDDKFPWEEHARIVDPETVNADVGKDMVDISNGFEFKITVEDTRNPDQMTLKLNPDGTLAGGWSADFNRKSNGKNMNYDMKSSFKGNIDPTCIYFDASGEDYSKLFVAARGKVTIVAIDNETNKSGMAGRDIFVSGWIDKDGKAKGNLGMFLDDGEYEIFKWHSTN